MIGKIDNTWDKTQVQMALKDIKYSFLGPKKTTN